MYAHIAPPPCLSPVYFPLMDSVWSSGWGPAQASGWQERVRVNKLRLLHRNVHHLSILISTICYPRLMLVTRQASLCTVASSWLRFVYHVGLRWVYLFRLCVSLLDATEDSTELLYFPSSFLVGMVDDGWHSFVSLPKVPARPLLQADSWYCWDNN